MDHVKLGCSKDDLDTPALCLDLDLMESNVRQIMAACRTAGVAWRPHAKGHKNSWIAQYELTAGAIGVTCAKLGEAEIMAERGVRDLLIANQLAGKHKVARLVELRRLADPIVTIDHLDQAEPISQAMQAAGLRVRCVIEVDIGLNRSGTQPGEPTLQLAQQLASLHGLQFVGLMGYEGHLLTLDEPQNKQQQIGAAVALLVKTKQLLEQAALPCPIISCGGTGSYVVTIGLPGVTEVQAGGAIFMDAFYRQQCQVPDLRFALTVLTTIVSRPTAERAIIDAGRKTMNVEVQQPVVLGPGNALGREGIEVGRLSAEHGELKLSPTEQSLRVGDRLEIVPGYADLTVMLHDTIYGFRQGRLEKILPVEARGKLQ